MQIQYSCHLSICPFLQNHNLVKEIVKKFDMCLKEVFTILFSAAVETLNAPVNVLSFLQPRIYFQDARHLFKRNRFIVNWQSHCFFFVCFHIQGVNYILLFLKILKIFQTLGHKCVGCKDLRSLVCTEVGIYKRKKVTY